MDDHQEATEPIMIGGIAVQTEEAHRREIAPTARPVVVTDIQMPFGSMVTFMIKWAIASIPAALILFLVFGMATGIVAGLVGGLTR